MPPDEGVQYSFAVEYHGPAVTYDLPRAVPITVEKIPVAAVATQVPLSNKLDLPVLPPILAPEPLSREFSREIKAPGPGVGVSPTPDSSFERRNEVGRDCASKGLVSGPKATVSLASVIDFEERETDGRDCVFSGELSSSGVLESSNGCSGSSEFSGLIDTAPLGLSSVRRNQHSHGSFGEGESSGSSGYLDHFVKSEDLSKSSSSLGLLTSNGCRDSSNFNDLNPPGWASNDSAMSLNSSSLRIPSFRTGDCNSEPTCDVRRIPVVTFCNIDSNDDAREKHSREDAQPAQAKREPEPKPRNGTCYRCMKGNRFTEKEVCIVCDAKYCVNCVIRAMGSMPEGRKCVTCIGYPINESKRRNLGKCSRLLKRLLNGLEVQQIMKAEMFCEANQLPAEYVYVNGKPLYQEELMSLQSCPNPPERLKPGSYWYDKVSGLWGKEGRKPSQVISSHLNVGGPIEANASNGKTQVFINGREITKVELRMLQFAGVQCAGNPHFWVNEDGSYQEEGQKNTKGYIWGKAGTKLLCAVLSLPIPSKSASSGGEQVCNLVSSTVADYLEQKTLQKLLLVGYDGSGTSTIFKQAKLLYKEVPFSEEERENIKLKIQTNVYGYLGVLLEGRERFENESRTETREMQAYKNSSLIGDADVNDDRTIYSINTRLKAFSDWLLNNMVSGNVETIFPAATLEYAPLVEELWNDAAIQATYNRRRELDLLPTGASYFLEQAVDIMSPEYEPSYMDILHAEHVTPSDGLACVDFSFPRAGPNSSIKTSDQQDSLLRYQLIRLHSRSLGENCKWLQMFEDVRIIIICVALSDYDQFSMNGNGTLINNMLVARKFFENVVTHRSFYHMDFLLVLNKFDEFEEKIERVPLTQCDWFDDFHPIISRHRANSSSINISASLGQVGFHYIAVKFKRLYTSLTDRKLYVSPVRGLEADSVDAALRYAREIVEWDEESMNFGLRECSIYSSANASLSN